MKTKTFEAARLLSQLDIEFLRAIYEFRCFVVNPKRDAFLYKEQPS